MRNEHCIGTFTLCLMLWFCLHVGVFLWLTVLKGVVSPLTSDRGE